MAHARGAGEHGVYTLSDYLAMLSDETRVSAYSGAITSLVKPGDRVIELGSGFGYFSVLAALSGAALVDAIDVNPVVHLGPRIAASNGCSDRIRFHCSDISFFEPEKPADVIIGDLRGPTPFARRSLEITIDARRRMLRVGGTMIARSDTLYCAPAHEPAPFTRRVHTPLSATPAMNLEPAATVAMTMPFQCAIAPDELLAPGMPWGEIDYAVVETPHHRGTARWNFGDPATMNGIAIWFETRVGGGYGFSTMPGSGATTYSHLYLPLATPLAIPRGGSVALNVAVHLVDGDYVWAWTARVCSPDGVECAVMTQNSIAARVLDPAAFGMGL